MNLQNYVAKKIEMERISVNSEQLDAIIKLNADGATIFFVAEYKRDLTGGLPKRIIRRIYSFIEEFKEREKFKENISKQAIKLGKMDELKAAIESACELDDLSDLWYAVKQKKQSPAQTAKDKGLEPLAKRIYLLDHFYPDENIASIAENYLSKDHGLPTIKDVYDWTSHIVAEKISENLEVRRAIREYIRSEGYLFVEYIGKAPLEKSNFKDYANFKETIRSLKQSTASHRYLAIVRGENEGELKVSVHFDVEKLKEEYLNFLKTNNDSPWISLFEMAALNALETLLIPSIASGVRSEIKNIADEEAIGILEENLEDLLLSAPFGMKAVVGIESYSRGLAKLAVVDPFGNYKFSEIINVASDSEENVKKLTQIFTDYLIAGVAIGNGQQSREIEKIVRRAIESDAKFKKKISKVFVNEISCLSYSNSQIAKEEFPELDSALRSAISLARKLQDPLSELVKVDPQTIGVGQYIHEVDGIELSKRLGYVVADIVNLVGVSVDTASSYVLSYVSGLNTKAAKSIVAYRKDNAIKSKMQLLNVPDVNEKMFIQAAGFLRIKNSENPLDNTGIHPVHYEIVEKILASINSNAKQALGNEELLNKVNVESFVNAENSKETIQTILHEMKHPGFDRRGQLQVPEFRDDVRTIADLKVGMVLEGLISNITNFGAFIDIGIDQHGLVHNRELPDNYKPRLNKAITVKVIEVDMDRERISLSMKVRPIRKDLSSDAENPKPEVKAHDLKIAEKDGKSVIQIANKENEHRTSAGAALNAGVSGPSTAVVDPSGKTISLGKKPGGSASTDSRNRKEPRDHIDKKSTFKKPEDSPFAALMGLKGQLKKK